MMVGAHFGEELGRRIDGRVHIAAEPFLGRHDRVRDNSERHVADDEQIDVAVVPELGSRSGAEYESGNDAIGQRSERLPQYIDRAHGLDDETL